MTNSEKIFWCLGLDAGSFLGPLLSQSLGQYYPIYAKMNTSLSSSTTLSPQEVEKEKDLNLPDHVLYGLPENIPTKTKQRLSVFENRRFYVQDEQSYYQTYDSLLSDQHPLILEMNHKMLQLARYSCQEIDRAARPSVAPENRKEAYLKENIHFFKGARLFMDDWSCDAVYAYNLANAIALTKLAGYRGIITKEEVLRRVVFVAKLIHNHFHTYEDFGLKCALAFKLDRMRLLSSSYIKDIQRDRRRYAHGVYSTWQYIPWPKEFEDDLLSM